VALEFRERLYEPFQLLRSTSFAIVFREGESVVLLRNGIRSRTVPAITVLSKMIIGLPGIITVEL
jgi:hypothetical protein